VTSRCRWKDCSGTESDGHPELVEGRRSGDRRLANVRPKQMGKGKTVRPWWAVVLCAALVAGCATTGGTEAGFGANPDSGGTSETVPGQRGEDAAPLSPELQAEIDRCRAEAEQNPTDPQRRHLLALALFRAGQTRDAAREWEKAVELDPSFAKAHYNLGVCLYGLGKVEEAEAHWLKTVELEPAHVSALYNLGVLKHNGGDLAAAIDHYRRCLSISPGHLKAQINLGLALASQQELVQAKEVWEQALARDPQCFNASYNLGVLSQQTNNVAAAVEHWKRAVEVPTEKVVEEMGDPATARRVRALAFYNLGVAAEEEEDLDKAGRYYRQALDLDGTNPLIRQAWRSTVRERRMGF